MRDIRVDNVVAFFLLCFCLNRSAARRVNRNDFYISGFQVLEQCIPHCGSELSSVHCFSNIAGLHSRDAQANDTCAFRPKLICSGAGLRGGRGSRSIDVLGVVSSVARIPVCAAAALNALAKSSTWR